MTRKRTRSQRFSPMSFESRRQRYSSAGYPQNAAYQNPGYGQGAGLQGAGLQSAAYAQNPGYAQSLAFQQSMMNSQGFAQRAGFGALPQPHAGGLRSGALVPRGP